MKNQLLSVVMPVYNGEKYLKKAIDSILDQTYHNFEFIIINDGSTDRTAQILDNVKDERVQLINQENKGLIFSLSYGISIAKGDWIARMDADDISYPNRFEEQLKYINNDYAVIGSQANIIDKNDKIYKTTKFELEHDKIISKLLKQKPEIIHPSVLINKSKFILTGGYDCKMLHAEDTDLWLRISRIGKIINVNRPLLALRKHEDNISKIKLGTSIINSYISLAHHYKSNSIQVMPDNEYNLLFKEISFLCMPLTKRINLLEITKEKIKFLSLVSKVLFMLLHPLALINYLIIKIQSVLIIFKIKSY